MNPNNWIEEVLAAVQEVLASGEQIPDEVFAQIADAIEEEQNLLQGNIPTPPQEPSNDAQLLWLLSGSQPQAFISYLRTFPTPTTQSLLGNPTALNSTIEQLQRQFPQGQLPVVLGIRKAPLNSSNVWGVQYDPKSGKMRVRFQGGSIYDYEGVPENIFKAFVQGNAAARTKGRNKYGEWWVGKNPSLGAALNQYIKAGGFPYQRIA